MPYILGVDNAEKARVIWRVVSPLIPALANEDSMVEYLDRTDLSAAVEVGQPILDGL